MDDNWIDVNDKLPDSDRQVYCLCEYTDRNTGETKYTYGVGNYLENLNVWVGTLQCKNTAFWQENLPLPDAQRLKHHDDVAHFRKDIDT